MDGAATVNKMVADDLENRWKAIQKRNTRQVMWLAPDEEGIIDRVSFDFLATVPYLKETQCRDTSQPPTDIVKTIVVPNGDQHAMRYNADLTSPPDLTNLPAPLERTIRLHETLSSGLLRTIVSEALTCSSLLVPSTITLTLH